MEEALHRSFGYIIAFLLPGLVVVYAILPLWPDLSAIGPATCGAELSLSAWIILLATSLGAGLIVSALRWLLIDTLHQVMGLVVPPLDFSRLHEQLDVFLIAVEHNYRFYQFYGNLSVSLVGLTAAHTQQPTTLWSWRAYLGLACLELLLLIASRDCLSRYYARLGQLLQGKPIIQIADG